jgi:hypothetical protein
VKKISSVLVSLGGLIVLAVAAYWDLQLKTWTTAPLWLGWAVKVGDALGLGIVIAVVAAKVESWVASAVAEQGPKVEIITADHRCDRLTQCVQENPAARLFTTRYSARSIGTTDKSKQFLSALDSRIHGRSADTFRVATLDSLDKFNALEAMLSTHYNNPRFGLKILGPNQPRLIDVMVSEGHFACLGIETRNPDENYWIRVDDPSFANEFRNFYEKNHWDRPEAVLIKNVGDILDSAGLRRAIDKLKQEAKTAGIIVQ